MITPVILSGGTGSRLWPRSRAIYPKQFLTFQGEHSLLQDTVLRACNIDNTATPIIICNEAHRFIVAEQLQRIDIKATIILEPEGRNTAPAAAVAALHAITIDPEATLLILPADHAIADGETFARAVTHATQATGKLITFGIHASSPETGFGYIRQGKPFSVDGIYVVDQFIEKPDQERAKQFLLAGGHHWNSGMFLFPAKTYLDELDQHAPDIITHCNQAILHAKHDLDFIRLDEAFISNPNISIDYGVMEHTCKAAVMPLDIGWSDIGSWSALCDIKSKDSNLNVLSGDVVIENTQNTYIESHHRLVAAVGVTDHIIIETPDAVLVSHKDHCQNVKHIVEQLKQQQRPEAIQHSKMYRPWGSYETIVNGERFQVKHIIVKPGEALSLQLHYHRAEHWVVVKGVATVTRGDEQYTLKENESTYIPVGINHRLENTSNEPVELIEVQSGSYLGEDDIVRLEDKYQRN